MQLKNVCAKLKLLRQSRHVDATRTALGVKSIYIQIQGNPKGFGNFGDHKGSNTQRNFNKTCKWCHDRKYY